jgi:ferredoxin
MKIPSIELTDCKLCEVCAEVCPAIFRINDAGYVEVADVSEYPEAEVQEAIKNCPRDCIFWMEI